MDQRVTKLKHKFNDSELAASLVAAGLDTPKKIKAVSKTELNKRIGKSKADQVKEEIG